jgi:hypothetical protein
MNFTSLYLWVTQKISSQYEHFYYGIYNIEKKNFLADVYVSSALGGLRDPRSKEHNNSRWTTVVTYLSPATVQTLSGTECFGFIL